MGFTQICQFGIVYVDLQNRTQIFRASLWIIKHSQLAASNHVNAIPASIDAKCCVESNLTGPDAAICRNLEDCTDLMSNTSEFGVFRCLILRGKNNRGKAKISNNVFSNDIREWNSEYKSQERCNLRKES